ncbi:protein HEAT INTOLERANT 4 [Cynara cardunculus var. scolymus]|uniref:protein HEAT INTOLERANT 4 n=1 Tax=Cynara cardunculus var. scolymus TaxID=59895 RepID=UPI000D62A32E|nr:protein HEAT INTOLERANT 4 [Cynara cardunculus var. scolymus]
MKKGTKRKAAAASRKDEAASTSAEATAATTTTTAEQQQEQQQKPTKAVRKTKRSKISKPESEPEYFDEQRDLEDLWKQVFPVGTEWDQLDLLSEYKWNFSNLEEAFEEGGVLHGKKVYLFSCTEPQLLFFQGQSKVTCIPVVVAVVSPFPPSDKIGINSVQRESEEILDMKQMKMDWVPYIPLGKRGSSVERLKSQIFILSCVQRRAGLKHLKLDRVKKFEYCLPYFYHPFKEDETEQSTIVDIMYPVEPKPVVCEFDWEMDELEEFANELIAAEELSEDQKDAFKEFVREKVREGKRANREAREKRRKAREEMSQEKVAAFQNMRFYKFYPVATTDTPDVSNVKSPFINRYYGKAHQVL